MKTPSITSWLLLSYFAPFLIFFFGVFWIGLNIWLFIGGAFLVSLMTLLLYLAFKSWQVDVSYALSQARKTVQAFAIKEHPLTALVQTKLKEKPTSQLTLCEEQHLYNLKARLNTLEEDHSRIVEAYENERNKLFDECTKKNTELQKGQNLQSRQREEIAQRDQEIDALRDEIENLKFEMKTLLQMDRELLSASVNEALFLK